MRYAWKKNLRQAGSAQEVGEILSQLAAGGELDPKEVLEAARPPTSPLHKYFNWDDTNAAEAFRVWQARKLIKSVVLVVESLATEADAPTPVFLNIISDDGEREYYETTTILETPSLYKKALEQALTELDRVRKKYEHLKELRDVWRAIKRSRRKR